MKKILAFFWLAVLFIIAGYIFWYNDYVYSLPTPVPSNYVKVNKGQRIAIDSTLAFHNNKPLFLHFFNPDCPCSKFNIPHFKALASRYNKQANFVVILMNNRHYTAQQVKAKYDLTVPVLFSPSMAKACGVYSTPQAAIIDAGGRLFYRGNYNSNRYCTSKKSEYARMALEGLLQKNLSIPFNPLAFTAYGCSLPNCNR